MVEYWAVSSEGSEDHQTRMSQMADAFRRGWLSREESDLAVAI